MSYLMGVFAMERRLVATVLLALTMMQTSAYAEVISDLPVPGESGEMTVTETVTTIQHSGPKTPPPPVAENVSRQYTGQVQVKELSRKKDGEIRKVTLREPITLQNLEIKILKSRLKVHEVTLLLAGGQRVDVRELRNSAVANTGTTLSSGNLNVSERVAAIEIRAESYGVESDLLLTAMSYAGALNMTAQGPALKSSTPAPLPAPGNHAEELAVIRVGDKVHFDNGNDYVGQVLEIFESGKARVKFEGYSEPSIIDVKNLGRSVNCKNGLCVGDRVLFQNSSNSYVGVITMSFADGKHQVRFPGYSSPSYIRSASLKKSVKCADEICSGDRVVYKSGSNHYAGTVQEVFAGGQASVRFDGYSGNDYVTTQRLNKNKSCASGICVDDRVLYYNGSNHYLGRVAEIFGDGSAKVRFDGYGGYDYIKADRLTKPVSSVGGFSVGTRVLFAGSSVYVGTVREIFANGTAAVRFDGYSGNDYIETKRLGHAMNCSGGICVGNRVIYNNQYTGTVREVFSNGYASVKFDGYSSVDHVTIRNLVK